MQRAKLRCTLATLVSVMSCSAGFDYQYRYQHDVQIEAQTAYDALYKLDSRYPSSFYLDNLFINKIDLIRDSPGYELKNLYQQLQSSADWSSYWSYRSDNHIDPALDAKERLSFFTRIFFWQYPGYGSFLEGLQGFRSQMINLFVDTLCKNDANEHIYNGLDTYKLPDNKSARGYLHTVIAQCDVHDWHAYFQYKYNTAQSIQEWSAADKKKIFCQDQQLFKQPGFIKLLRMMPEYEQELKNLLEHTQGLKPEIRNIVQNLYEACAQPTYREQLVLDRKRFIEELQAHQKAREHSLKELAQCASDYKTRAATADGDYKKRMLVREKIINLMLKSNPDVITKFYDHRNFVGSLLSPEGLTFLQKFGKADQFKECSGSPIQQRYHAELCVLANAIGKKLSVLPYTHAISSLLADQLVHARNCNLQNGIQRTGEHVDFCWFLVDLFEANPTISEAELCKHRDAFYPHILTIGDTLLAGNTALQEELIGHKISPEQDSYAFIRRHMNLACAQHWQQTLNIDVPLAELDRALTPNTKTLVVDGSHRIPCASYRSFIQELPGYGDQMLALHEKFANHDKKIVATFNAMPSPDKARLLGFVEGEHLRITKYAYGMSPTSNGAPHMVLHLGPGNQRVAYDPAMHILGLVRMRADDARFDIYRQQIEICDALEYLKHACNVNDELLAREGVSSFFELLTQGRKLNYCMIELALQARQDATLQRSLKILPDATYGSVLDGANYYLQNAKVQELQSFYEWKYPDRGALKQWSFEQKKELFANWSTWNSHAYIKLFEAMGDFNRFILEVAHDKALLQQLKRYETLPVYGTVAKFIESAARDALAWYRDKWEQYSFENGPRAVKMRDLSQEERFTFYKDLTFYRNSEAADYLRSYGQEYDAHMVRLKQELEQNAQLKQEFAGAIAHNGMSALTYAQQEGTQAQQRMMRPIATATQDLVHNRSEMLGYLHEKYTCDPQSNLYTSEAQERFQQRIQSIKMVMGGNHEVVLRHYDLTEAGTKFTQALGMNVYELQHYHGNVIQQQVHGELVTILNEAAAKKNAIPGTDYDRMGLLIGEYAKIAHEFNKNMSVDKAFTVADLCWGLLDCLMGLDQGVQQGIARVGNMILHPIDTLTGMAHGTFMISKALTDLEALADLYDYDEALAEQKMGSYVANIDKALTVMQEQAKNVTARDAVQGTAAFVTEWALTGKVFAATSVFLQEAKQKALQFAEKAGELLTKESAILKTAEGLEAKVVGDVAEQMSKMSVEKVNQGKLKNPLTQAAPIYTYKNGRYAGVKYHHSQSSGLKGGHGGKGIKSAAPKDGQVALDNSVLVKDKGHFDRRVGISDGEIVVLDGNIRDGYHGHVRTWEEICADQASNDVKSALLQNKFVDHKGKFS